MTATAEIEDAVSRLPPEDLAAFSASFAAFEAERLDRRIAVDAASGMLDRFVEEALADLRRGDVRELRGISLHAFLAGVLGLP